MSRRAPLPLEKLARAAKLSAEATRLYAEAAAELQAACITPPPPANTMPPVTELDVARAAKVLKAKGYKL